MSSTTSYTDRSSNSLASYKQRLAQEIVAPTNVMSAVQRQAQKDSLTKLWITGFATNSTGAVRAAQIRKLVAKEVGNAELGLVVERSKFDYALISSKLEDAEGVLAVVRDVVNRLSDKGHKNKLHARWTHMLVPARDPFNDRLRQVSSHFASHTAFRALGDAMHAQYGLIRGCEYVLPMTSGPSLGGFTLARIEDVPTVVASTFWCNTAKKYYIFQGPTLRNKTRLECPETPYELVIERIAQIDKCQIDHVVRLLLGKSLLSRETDEYIIITPTSFEEAVHLCEQWDSRRPRHSHHEVVLPTPEFLVEYNSRLLVKKSKDEKPESDERLERGSIALSEVSTRLDAIEAELRKRLDITYARTKDRLVSLEVAVKQIHKTLEALVQAPQMQTILNPPISSGDLFEDLICTDEPISASESVEELALASRQSHVALELAKLKDYIGNLKG